MIKLLTGTEVVNFGYNARGEQTSATYAPGTSNARTVRYGYDFEGRLTTWGEVDSPTGYSSNLFDAHGNRVAQTNGAGTSLAKQTRFVVDENLPNAQVLEEWELDGTGTGAQEKLEASYVYGDPDELVRLARRNSTTGSYDLSYVLSDGLDSARQLTGEGGAVSDAYAYDAYGKGAAQVGATNNPYRFNSQRLEGNGNYFLRARQYNPAQGRFTSEDPMLGYASNPITQHRYQYGGLNPMMMVDPSGEEFSLCGMMSSIGMNTAFTVRAVGVGMNIYDAAQSIDAWTQIYWDYAATGEIDNEALAMNIADIVLPHVAIAGFKKIFKRWLCFPAGTPVLMADGTKKAIEKIEAGDLVVSRDEKSGETKAKKVVKHWERQAQATLVLHFQSGEKIEATAEHPFFVEGEGFRPAAQLGIGTSIVTRAGPSAKIVKITRSEKPVKVYNFEVEDFHTYFVGNVEAWAHNSYSNSTNETLGRLTRSRLFTQTQTLGRRVYKNALDFIGGVPSNVDMDFLRSTHPRAAAILERGGTNKELMQAGYAPIGHDGLQIQLHHVTGDEPGAMIELAANVHRRHSGPLHAVIADGESFRNSRADLRRYERWRARYWRDRAGDF